MYFEGFILFEVASSVYWHCGFRREGKLDKCFLPTKGREVDVSHKFVKKLSPSVAVLCRQASLLLLKVQLY